MLKEQFAKGYLIFGFIRGLNFTIENDLRKVIKNRDITFPCFRILWILYFDSKLSMTELTYLAQINISNVFRQLTKLKEDGLVIIENGHDARKKEISLTTDGRNLIQEFIKQNSDNSQIKLVHLIKQIPKEDLTKFIEVGSILSDSLMGKEFSEFINKTSADLLE